MSVKGVKTTFMEFHAGPDGKIYEVECEISRTVVEDLDGNRESYIYIYPEGEDYVVSIKETDISKAICIDEAERYAFDGESYELTEN